jgi:hypothetical protein
MPLRITGRPTSKSFEAPDKKKAQGNLSTLSPCAEWQRFLEYRAAALDQADQNGNYRQDKQNVNESTQRVRADHAQQPEDQE